MPVFETLGKVNRYKKFFLKRWPSWPSCAEASMQGLERAQLAVICTLFGVHHEYLNVRWFDSYYFKECTYLPMKTLIWIFSLLFVKICGKVAAQLPLWMNCHWYLLRLLVFRSSLVFLAHWVSAALWPTQITVQWLRGVWVFFGPLRFIFTGHFVGPTKICFQWLIGSVTPPFSYVFRVFTGITLSLLLLLPLSVHVICTVRPTQVHFLSVMGTAWHTHIPVK